MKARKTHDPNHYHVLDAKCLGRKCFHPGIYTIRGATQSGSKNSGQSATCMTIAHDGCPMEPVFSPELKRERKAAGWRVR